MKKLLALIVMLLLAFSLASCDDLPEALQGPLDSIMGMLGVEETHEHEFVQYESKRAFCERDGYVKYKCACGEEKEEIIPKLGHDVQYNISTTAPSCTMGGTIYNRCSRCTYNENETIPRLGHEWGEFEEYSRLIVCTRDKCSATQLVKSETAGKYEEALAFKFGDTEKAALSDIHNELAAILTNAAAYDPALHGITTEGELYDEYKAAEALYEQYSDLIFEAQGQYSIAMTLYYCDQRNADLEKIYNDMQTYYTDLVASFYSLSQPWYDCKFREFFFEGATEDEIKAFLADSAAYSDEEYMALKNRNDEIELEYYGITSPEGGEKVPELYYEFVQNNKQIAEILGYDNYLEYAYENVYDRDYSYEDAALFVEYVKKYIVPIYNDIYDKWVRITSSRLSENDLKLYNALGVNSFFDDALGNKLFNDYIDDCEMAFTSNPDKQISFSDTLNNLMVDGNLFRGSYKGAYVTYVRGVNVPIVYFGNGRSGASTVAHEFGHYMNEIYNDDMYNQSFDLHETHSQGQEMLFLQYIKNLGIYGGTTLELAETYQMLNAIYIIVLATQVDCFEQAVYLDSYDGSGADEIMADGTITADEYDDLFAALSVDFGISKDYREDTYWRRVTISSPCYYISYAVSAVNALQIYANAANDFNAAKESYLKLFTYTDVDPDMTLEEVLEYAGLTSYTDEKTFKNISLNVG